MILTGTFRIGQDPELRYSANGTPNMQLSLAYNVGFGDKKTVQWLRATIFGKQAESLQPYLTKGSQIFAVVNDPKVDEFTKKDGSAGVSFGGIIQTVELIGGKPAEQQAAPAQPTRRAPPVVEDDIPFAPINRRALTAI